MGIKMPTYRMSGTRGGDIWIPSIGGAHHLSHNPWLFGAATVPESRVFSLVLVPLTEPSVSTEFSVQLTLKIQ